MKPLVIFSLLSLSACSTKVFQEPFDGSAHLYAEVFNKSDSCKGKGITIKGVKKRFGSLVKFEGNEVYLEKGTYFIYYTFKEQVEVSPVKVVNGSVVRCATTGLLIDSMKSAIEKSTGSLPSITRWPRVKIIVESDSKYYLRVQDGQLRVGGS